MKATLTQNNSKFDKVPMLLFVLVGTFTKCHVAPQNCLRSNGNEKLEVCGCVPSIIPCALEGHPWKIW